MFKKYLKNLLSQKLDERDAQNIKSSKIKPRFPKFKGFWRLKILFLTLLLVGLQPALSVPLVGQVVVQAQGQEIVAQTLPQLLLPHPGFLSTRFSRFHHGVDIVAGLGIPVHPITDGEVLEVNFWFWGYGNHVILSHQGGLKSLYAHLGRVYVKKGQLIKQKETLGIVGMSGFTSGPHTHLEVTKDGQALDPTSVLPEIPDYPVQQTFD